jgi:hypothetical protein
VILLHPLAQWCTHTCFVCGSAGCCSDAVSVHAVRMHPPKDCPCCSQASKARCAGLVRYQLALAEDLHPCVLYLDVRSNAQRDDPCH